MEPDCFGNKGSQGRIIRRQVCLIALLIGLLLSLPCETIYGPAQLSYGNLQRVVERKGWQGTDHFDVLLAVPDCNLVARQGWLISETGIYSAVIVDCEADDHKGQMAERGLLADTNRDDLTHQWAWVVVR